MTSMRSTRRWYRPPRSGKDLPCGNLLANSEKAFAPICAVRKDYFLDHDHSAYVDQWDWERVITAEQRNLDFVKAVVSKIWKVIVSAERFSQSLFPQLKDFR